MQFKLVFNDCVAGLTRQKSLRGQKFGGELQMYCQFITNLNLARLSLCEIASYYDTLSIPYPYHFAT